MASSSILLSATSRTSTGSASFVGWGSEPYAASATPPAKTSLRPARRGPEVHADSSDQAQWNRSQGKCRPMVGSSRRKWRIGSVGDIGPACDCASDGDALAGLERADHRPVDVTVTGQGAAAGGAGLADVARGIVEGEPGDHDLESVGPQLLGLARVTDDVEGELSGRQPGVGKCVGEDVAVLPGVGGVRVADADSVASLDGRNVDVGIGIGRRSLDVGRVAEIGGDYPLVATALLAAEVLVDDLADAHSVAAARRDGDDL